MYFYLLSLAACLIDFLICQFFKKQHKYSWSESLVTLIFYFSDIWFVLYIRTQQSTLGEMSRLVWKIKYDFLERLNQIFIQLYSSANPLENYKVAYYFVLFLLVDFSYYWIHRVNHEVGIIWTQHAVHHSSTKFNFLATQRNSFRFTTFNFQQIFFIIPMSFLFPLEGILTVFACIQVSQTLIHSEWIPRFWRPVELVFNTPWHHRIHHSVGNKQGNYGGVLIIFDRFFGTIVEVPDKNFQYGILGDVPSNNPIKINFKYFFIMGKKIWAERSIKGFFKHAIVPSSLHKYLD